MRRAGGPNNAPVPDNHITDAERDQLRRILAVGYGIAACTGAFAALTLGSGNINVGLLVLAGIELPIALALALIPAMPERWIKFFGFPVTVIVISVGIAVARPLGPTPIYYLWPALTAGHYGSRRDCLLVCVMLVFGFAGALVLTHDAQIPVITYIVVVSIFLLVLGGTQRERINTLMLNRELAHAASTDALTGLLNRRAFNEAFTREVERGRHLGPAAQRGHVRPRSLQADQRRARPRRGRRRARRVRRHHAPPVLEPDRRARPHGRRGVRARAVRHRRRRCAAASADAIAEAFADWSRHRPTAVMTGPLTTSAGIATLAPHCATPTELLIVADRALYAAKAAGRNRVMRAGETQAHVLAKVA